MTTGDAARKDRLQVTDEAVHEAPVVPVMRSIGRRAWRALDLARRAAGRAVVEFYRSDNLTFAASIAYYTLLSLFPFLLLVLTLISRITIGQEGGGGERLLTLIASALPSRFEFLSTQAQGLAAAPLPLSVAGTLVTIWASMGVFGAITSAVNHAWGVEKSYSFLKHKLVAFMMMSAAGLLAITALALVSAAQVVEAQWFAGVLARYPELAELSGLLYNNAATLIFIVVVGLIYYFIPNAQVRLRDVWFGAILAGVLWRLVFDGFAWYVRDLSRFSVHGSIGAVVVFLIWIYLSAVILLYGVEVTAAYARLRKHLPQQVPAAPAREA